MNPLVFIIGCARSGTTLLQHIVSAHPQIAITPELHWVTNTRRGGKRLGFKGLVSSEQVAQWLVHKRFAELEISPHDFRGLMGCDETLRCADFLNRLFAAYAAVKRKQLVGNKTPYYGMQLPALHAHWPNAKVIHVIRDGREVCLSILNWKKAGRSVGRNATWSDDPVTTTALWWKRKVRVGREHGKVLGPGLYHELRYESLVARPVEECARLCEFLGVPYAEDMLRFHEMTPARGLRSKQTARPITPGLRDWRSQMTATDVELFEAAAGELLDELAYSRAAQTPRQAVVAHHFEGSQYA
jgi:hypothetical protein